MNITSLVCLSTNQQCQSIAASPKIQKEIKRLSELINFSQKPSWESFRMLSMHSIYLIAARAEYSKVGWTFTTRYHLIKQFDNKFKANPTLSTIDKGIKEAILIQKKILAIKIMKHGLKARINPDNLSIDYTEIYNELKTRCKTKFPLENNRSIGTQLLEKYVNHQKKLQEIFREALASLKAAYMHC